MSSPQQAEFDRMRSYYLSQGERYSFSEMWPRVVKARMQLLDSLEGVTNEQATFKPVAEDWSIVETALHALGSSQNVRRLVVNLATGQSGDSSNVEPARKLTDLTVAELIVALRDDGIAWTSAIEKLPAHAPMSPTSPHTMFGELGARPWYIFQRTHDIDHAKQIDAVKAVPGYPGGAS